MAPRFVDDAGVWEVDGPVRPCAHCSQPATLTYVAELGQARRGPGPSAFCTPTCWGLHADAHARVVQRSSEATIGEAQVLMSWPAVLDTYPRRGDQGLSSISQRGVETLLYRDADGVLLGVLQVFPRPLGGPWTVLVDPARRGERVGTKLCREAARRWGVYLPAQKSTPEGYGMEIKALRPTPPFTSGSRP